MNCIICLDSGDEPLIKNTLCVCVYKKHNSCWNNYIKTTDKCPLCRIHICIDKGQIYKAPIVASIIAPIIAPIVVITNTYQTSSDDYVQISYEEFQTIVQSEHPDHVIQISHDMIKKSTIKKGIKAVAFACILVVIIIVIMKLVI